MRGARITERIGLSADRIRIVWISAGGCDGCTMAFLGASQPSLEELLLGQVPDAPGIELVHPVLSLEAGDRYMEALREAAEQRGPRYVLVVEGSLLDESLAGEGYFSRLGDPGMSSADWVDRLAPGADAVIAIGSCATWGGIPAAAGSITGATGLETHLGRGFRSRKDLPVVNVPGCAPPGDAFVDTLVYVFLHLAGDVPLELDRDRRPMWLYRERTAPRPPRSVEPGKPPKRDLSVGCPVPSTGWMNGIGGCASVGGACIGCTARGFADRHLRLARLPS